jgi:2-polyprenyl-3-methyl-5-hydroxy-6-metoxy-1,4-benzoquinol methylase
MDCAAMIAPEFPHLQNLIDRQLAVFPGHRGFLEKRFFQVDAAGMRFSDEIAGKVTQIAGDDLGRMCEDYHWLNGIVLDEELHFRRTGRYRLSTFAQADEEVYSNPQLMSRYMNGLLASQLWWRNHTDVLQFFRDEFIARSPRGFTHLEIGPGHGLLLYLAAASPHCKTAEAWDVSDASLLHTQKALAAMRMDREVSLKSVNLFQAPRQRFMSIAFSEVLEHLEEPQRALKILFDLLADGGRLFLNAPVNSPAPDHLYLFETPEQILEMVAGVGFVIESSLMAPCTGSTLERARRLKLTISVGTIARKP